MASSYVTVFNGSPRRNGNSEALARRVAAGAEAAGADVESFYLHGMEIHPCRACDACQEDVDKDCVVHDDMQLLYPKLRRANAIVIASPVYWFTVSAQTKLLMDRWYALGGPQGYALSGKRFGIVLTYGDTDPFTSGAINAMRTFQDALGFVGAEIVGMVYGTAMEPGEIKRDESLMRKAFELGQRLAAAA